MLHIPQPYGLSRSKLQIDRNSCTATEDLFPINKEKVPLTP
uniref:Uncharacterized protein n=1 Tax=Arundo donax TaxID=35708 RepID=A0A0A8YB34_ARUDO